MHYLPAQATANPRTFLSLRGRLISTQVTGKDDAPLIPERAAQALLLLIRSLPAPGTGSEVVVFEASEFLISLVASVALPGSSPAGVPN